MHASGMWAIAPLCERVKRCTAQNMCVISVLWTAVCMFMNGCMRLPLSVGGC